MTENNSTRFAAQPAISLFSTNLFSGHQGVTPGARIKGKLARRVSNEPLRATFSPNPAIKVSNASLRATFRPNLALSVHA